MNFVMFSKILYVLTPEFSIFLDTSVLRVALFYLFYRWCWQNMFCLSFLRLKTPRKRWSPFHEKRLWSFCVDHIPFFLFPCSKDAFNSSCSRVSSCNHRSRVIHPGDGLFLALCVLHLSRCLHLTFYSRSRTPVRTRRIICAAHVTTTLPVHCSSSYWLGNAWLASTTNQKPFRQIRWTKEPRSTCRV